MKKGLLLLGLVLLTAACGKKSTIKTHVEARALGDGKHVTFPIVVPLSDKAISSFSSPVSDMNPLFRGFVGSIMNLGASMGAGKKRVTIIQPIPEIPDSYIASIKIKRIFFLIEKAEKKDDRKREEKTESFEFLRRLAVKVSATNDERDVPTWEPVVRAGDMDDDELSYFWSLFRSKRERHAAEWEKNSSGLLLLKYNEDEKDKSLRGNEFGNIHIIQTDKPHATRIYLENKYKKYFTRIHTLSNSILVEFKKGRVLEEKFKNKLAADALKVEELNIGVINQCDDNFCMDLKVEDRNLIPMLKKGNALKIDAYIDPRYAPKSFQLKGFLEFEVKIKSKI